MKRLIKASIPYLEVKDKSFFINEVAIFKYFQGCKVDKKSSIPVHRQLRYLNNRREIKARSSSSVALIIESFGIKTYLEIRTSP
jgi:hypothetical protein